MGHVYVCMCSVYGKFVRSMPQNIWRSQDIFCVLSILFRFGSFMIDHWVYHVASLQASGDSSLHFHLINSMLVLQIYAAISDFLHGYWGSKFYSSNFHGKHFIHWTNSEAPHWFFLPQSCHTSPTPGVFFLLFPWLPDPSLGSQFKYHVLGEVFTLHSLYSPIGFIHKFLISRQPHINTSCLTIFKAPSFFIQHISHCLAHQGLTLNIFKYSNKGITSYDGSN